MHTVHEKTIQAVIAKAEQACPDSLALIGVYRTAGIGVKRFENVDAFVARYLNDSV